MGVSPAASGTASLCFCAAYLFLQLKALYKVIIPAVVLGAAAFIGQRLSAGTGPAASEVKPRPPIPVIAAVVQPRSYQVMVATRGEVRARTESTLVPEVSGVIASIAPSLRDGGFFEAGEELLKLDDRDHQTAVVVARSALAQAETALSEEKARAAQAAEDWKGLGRSGEPGPLVLRVPQVNEAQLKVDSSKAQLEKAGRDLERTSIRAPFAGRIMKKLADVGQYVTTGRELARIYAVDTAEIDLPVSNAELAFLDLPEDYRGEARPPAVQRSGPPVQILAEYGGHSGKWEGRIVRAAGGIDRSSRQLYLTAQVENPYQRRDADSPPLKVGLWVTALIQGRNLENVFVVPRAAIREGDSLLIIDQEKTLRTRQVTILRGEKDHVVITEGLKPGEMICTVPLHYAVEGSPVKVEVQPLPHWQAPGVEAAASALQTKSAPAPEAPAAPKAGI